MPRFSSSFLQIRRLLPGLALICAAGSINSQPPQTAAAANAGPVVTVPGKPPVIDRHNLYSEIGAGTLSPAVHGALERRTPR